MIAEQSQLRADPHLLSRGVEDKVVADLLWSELLSVLGATTASSGHSPQY